ncbi:hypothetical protein KM043_008019 [Ampulex compressa]|nr:hypothetical protein KM043_008019 [Ampulex compressa]
MAKSLETVAQISGEECRVCLKRCTETCQLFDSGFGIARKLMAVAAVQVEEGDGLPSSICNACNQLLDTSYDFRCQIQSSDSKLRRLLHLGSTGEEDTKSATIVKAIIADVLSSVMSYKQNNAEDRSDFLEDQLIKQEALCPPKGEPKLEVHSDGTEELDNRLNANCSDDEERPLISRTTRQRCAYCIKSFSTKLALQRHMIVHQRKTKLRYVCYACDKQFANVGKLKSHVFSSHNGAKEKRTIKKNSIPEKRAFKFTCKVCTKQFTYQKSFVTHAKSHPEYEQEVQEDNAHVDRVEAAEEKSQEEALMLKELKEEDADEDEEQEEEEEEEDEEEEEEEEDDGDLPAENLQCTQCGKLFATKRNLKRHISTHSGLKFNCTTCGKGFSRIDKLKDHEQSKHKEEVFGHSDDEDEDGTDNENKVNENLENRKKERHNRPHKCTMCPKAFAQAQSLANHLERHKRVKETQKRFLCEPCLHQEHVPSASSTHAQWGEAVYLSVL